MKIFDTKSDRNNYLKLILKIVLALAVIQFLRAGIFGSLWFSIQPGNNISLFQVLNGIDFIIVGIILLLLFKPSLDDLGLKWNDIRLRTRILYIFGFSTLIILVFTPYTFEWELQILILGLVFGIITPLFEEILFRGYIWGKISTSGGMVNPDVLTLLTVTLLFSIWHLGYIDVLLLHPMKMGNLGMIMLLKISIGLVLGLIVGYLRMKTGKTYASTLFHGLWNVMAP